MLNQFNLLGPICAFLAMSVFGLSEDPNAILDQMNKRGVYAVFAEYRGFLSEIAEDLKSSSLTESKAAIDSRVEWLANFGKYEKLISTLYGEKSNADSSPNKSKEDIENLKKKIAEQLAFAESYKVSAHNIIYLAKVADAAKVEAREVVKDLWPVTKQNQNIVWNDAKTHVLGLSFMTKRAYENFWKPQINNGELILTNRNSWFSLVPQLKGLLKEHVRSKSHYSINDRSRQILGLPPEKDSVERVYVEFWIQPKDMLRPCPDNEIDDNVCEADYYHLGEDVFAKVKRGRLFVVQTTGEVWENWYLNERKDKYTGQMPFPWTRLGYTFDYGRGKQKKAIGVSEYISKGGSTIKIKGVYSPEDYVKLAN